VAEGGRQYDRGRKFFSGSKQHTPCFQHWQLKINIYQEQASSIVPGGWPRFGVVLASLSVSSGSNEMDLPLCGIGFDEPKWLKK